MLGTKVSLGQKCPCCQSVLGVKIGVSQIWLIAILVYLCLNAVQKKLKNNVAKVKVNLNDLKVL